MPLRIGGRQLLRADPSWQIRNGAGVSQIGRRMFKKGSPAQNIVTAATGRSLDRPPTVGHVLSSTAATTEPALEGETFEAPQKTRQAELKHARPFSDFLTDTFQRQHDYLRISLTERCNLRCLYCMPEEGVELSPARNLLTTPEVLLLADVFVGQGVKKIRLTGGEPTVRRDILPLMRQLGDLRRRGLRELCLTTNGLALHRKLDAMVEAGLTGVNLSLDTLDPFQFRLMTRRDGLVAVRRSMDRILALNAAGADVRLKINCVVMRGLNDGEMVDFVGLTRDHDLEVRFIEYMPFDGNRWSTGKMVSFNEMLERIRKSYPTLQRTTPDAHHNRLQDTSKTYEVPGFAGRVGFITSMTSNFCGGCNRLRITSDGSLKVCLFGNAEVSLRDIIRQTNGGEPIDETRLEALTRAAQEAASSTGDPDTDLPISHVLPNASALLDVIGMAVKRKKERHAGMDELKHMKNRPMILIGSSQPLPQAPRLTHVSASGTAHMVPVGDKKVTARTAAAACTVQFSNSVAAALVRANEMAKGDVLGVARVAGIMAAKRTSELIPLCHPLMLSYIGVDLEVSTAGEGFGEGSDDNAKGSCGHVKIWATVRCEGKTGVEMEALTAASAAALTVFDMCKAVDKGMRIEGLRVVLKDGGKSGRWEEKGWRQVGGSD
ncbi:molybdopterin cofactor biosynthetic protein [Grosmannia clavigera kw1407]|uniref:Molybdopterin cofactor biosynthetic protein n=1 Tax=Grosmannia clavigera (strain kw1407 / UAMH 11150) TaxID=655863 RepID=F0XBX0_GROCL|nr:molybdopterin cofactor biosynthetic protein [Grosmannia clavigera kw1407]EFX03854.1 molybdopterin cofactor biosynthetic protein [Grosmannia clavigera kw1407]